MDPATLAFVATIGSSILSGFNGSKDRDAQKKMSQAELAERKREFDLQNSLAVNQDKRAGRAEPLNLASGVSNFRQSAMAPTSYDYLGSLAGRY